MEVYLLFEHAVLGVNPVFAFLISPTEVTVYYFYNRETSDEFSGLVPCLNDFCWRQDGDDDKDFKKGDGDSCALPIVK